ncbi:hypothetical protein QBC41DRAFT_226137, partial [Cercophora samala]
NMSNHERASSPDNKPFENFELQARVYSSLDSNTGETCYYLAPILSDPLGTDIEFMIIKDIQERLPGVCLTLPGTSAALSDGDIVAFSGADIEAIGKSLRADLAPDINKGFRRSKALTGSGQAEDRVCGRTEIPVLTEKEILSSGAIMAEWERFVGQLKPFPKRREWRDGRRVKGWDLKVRLKPSRQCEWWC